MVPGAPLGGVPPASSPKTLSLAGVIWARFLTEAEYPSVAWTAPQASFGSAIWEVAMALELSSMEPASR
ncbi:hypothetical protein JTF08_08600 [Micrococcaceae bacterium RIT802]|nr:hypothetical protein [Micrococcaceae bacterium RIT 802]